MSKKAETNVPKRGPPDEPRDWETAVSAAYLRSLGGQFTQEVVCAMVGVCRRTLGRWEKADWWPRAKSEAVERWLQGLVHESTGTLLKEIRKGDAASARWALERLIPELAPPAQKHDHSGSISFYDAVMSTQKSDPDDGED